MRKTVLAVAVLLLAQPMVHAQQAKNAPGWLANLEQAKAQARQSGKPIFLVFR